MKNVVLISLDSLRGDFLRCCGNKNISTPNIDSLAERGVLFKNVIVQAPYTVASHASMLTGLYPFNHGIRMQFTKQKLTKRALFALHTLKKLDFKLLSFVGVNVFGPQHGYDIWDFQGRSKILNIWRELRRNRNNRFFCFIHYFGIHTPYPGIHLRDKGFLKILENPLCKIRRNDFIYIRGASRLDSILFGGDIERIKRIRKIMKSNDRDDIKWVKKGYRKAVEHADLFVGRVVDVIKKLDLSDKTALLITSDHGESFNEYNEIEEFPDDYEHGPFLYDTLIKVPLIIYNLYLPKGKVIDQQVQCIDIIPTVFALLDKSSVLQGRINGSPLLNYISDETVSDTYDCAYSETMKDTKEKRESVIKKACIRTKDGYKLVADYNNDSFKLYNCNRGESEDISEHKPELVSELKEVLEKFIERNKIESDDRNMMMGQKEHEELVRRLQELGYIG